MMALPIVNFLRSCLQASTNIVQSMSKLKGNSQKQWGELRSITFQCLIQRSQIGISPQMEFRNCMIYIKEVFDKYKSAWPLNFNTQPPGFSFSTPLSSQQSENLKSLVTARQNNSPCKCKEGWVILADQNFTQIISQEGPGRCVLDHPIMILAQSHGQSILKSQEIKDKECGIKRPLQGTGVDQPQPGERYDGDSQYFMKDLNLIAQLEPCFMCCMALVHSRISRVYYLNENPVDGGLTSCGVQIGQLRNLNHSFQIFQLKVASSSHVGVLSLPEGGPHQAIEQGHSTGVTGASE